MKQARKHNLAAENLRFAKRFISDNLTPLLVQQLRELTSRFSLSLKFGDIILLSGGWYVTHAGLIRLAERSNCSGMQVHPVRQLSDPSSGRYAFRATVYKSSHCRGFVGYGDADPSNVSFLVQGAEMRVAETRAVNRALRKAYGIGICSVEEIGSLAERLHPLRNRRSFLPTYQRELRRANCPRSSLPTYSPASTGRHPRQVVRHRFLRREELTRGHSRAGRKLRRPPGRLG